MYLYAQLISKHLLLGFLVVEHGGLWKTCPSVAPGTSSGGHNGAISIGVLVVAVIA
jgi:hypothetical protein